MVKYQYRTLNGNPSQAGLSAVAANFLPILGYFWAVRIVGQEDEDNWFDPPVAYVEARLFSLKVRICASGEVYFDGDAVAPTEAVRFGEHFTPDEVCRGVLDLLRESNYKE